MYCRFKIEFSEAKNPILDHSLSDGFSTHCKDFEEHRLEEIIERFNRSMREAWKYMADREQRELNENANKIGDWTLPDDL